MRNRRHGACHAAVHLSLAAHAQVDALHVEVALQDARCHHAGARGTATVQDARAVEHKLLLLTGAVNTRLSNLGTRFHTNLHPVDAIIEWQINHIFMPTAIKLINVNLALN